MEYRFYYNSPIGILEIFIKNNAVVLLKSVDKLGKNTQINAFINDIKTQLDEYFSGERKIFDIKTELVGTDFQKKVWNELIKIPYGKTKTYGEIAKLIGNKNAQRAVGNACNKNPIMIIVLCQIN